MVFPTTMALVFYSNQVGLSVRRVDDDKIKRRRSTYRGRAHPQVGIHEATWRFEEKGPRVQDETALVAEIDKKRIGMDLPQSIFWATNDLTN